MTGLQRFVHLAATQVVAAVLMASAWGAQASPSPAPASLLQRALNCDLNKAEVAPLIQDLARTQTEFRKPSARHFLPAADVYRLRSPVMVQGHTASTVVVARMRILALLPGRTVGQAAQALQLVAPSEPPAVPTRLLKPGASLVAESFDHPGLDGHLLLGCAYDHVGAAHWVPEFKGPPVGRDQPNPLRGWMD